MPHSHKLRPKILNGNAHLCPPHKPEFKDINVAPTLQSFVSGVIGQVVVLVLLKEVGSVHLIAALHDTLGIKRKAQSGGRQGTGLGYREVICLGLAGEPPLALLVHSTLGWGVGGNGIT